MAWKDSMPDSPCAVRQRQTGRRHCQSETTDFTDDTDGLNLYLRHPRNPWLNRFRRSHSGAKRMLSSFTVIDRWGRCDRTNSCSSLIDGYPSS